MVLDLSGRSHLKKEHAVLLNKIADEYRSQVTDLVDKISTSNSKSIDWWVTPLASRNPFASDFSIRCYRLIFLKKLIEQHFIPSIILVDTPAMAAIVKQLVHMHNVKVRIVWPTYLKLLLYKPLKNILSSSFNLISQLAFSKLLNQKNSPLKNIILLDSFLYADSFSSGGFVDKHFPDFERFLYRNENESIRIFPTFYRVRNYINIFLDFRKCENRFILKESFLEISDYVDILKHTYRVLSINTNHIELVIDGVNVNLLIRDELLFGLFKPSSMESFLKYKAIKRMAINGITLRRVIIWFENQDIHKGLCAGLRKYFPKTEIVGYVGFFASKNQLCVYPSDVERLSNVIPTKIAVMGPGFRKIISEFCSDLKFINASALRYNLKEIGIHSATGVNDFRIVVALPIIKTNSTLIMSMLSEMLKGCNLRKLFFGGITILIKPHGTSLDFVNYQESIMGDEYNIAIEVTNERFDSLLLNADLVLSGQSSACVESIAYGVPVVVIPDDNDLAFIPIPEGISRNLWRVAHDSHELYEGIRYLLKNKNYAEKKLTAAKVRELYFNCNDRHLVRNLMVGSE